MAMYATNPSNLYRRMPVNDLLPWRYHISSLDKVGANRHNLMNRTFLELMHLSNM